MIAITCVNRLLSQYQFYRIHQLMNEPPCRQQVFKEKVAILRLSIKLIVLYNIPDFKDGLWQICLVTPNFTLFKIDRL